MNELMQPIHPAYAALLSGKRPEPCEPFVEVSSKVLARLLDVVEFGDQLERVEKDNLLSSMKELLAQEQPELWVIHSVGPGELHPMISKEAADSQAAELAEMFKEHVGKLGLRFDVIRSPFTPLEHFEILAEEVTDHRDNLLGHCNAMEKKLAETPAPAVAMPPEISRDLLGKIVDEVFDGAIEDASVIEDVYRVIVREQQAAPVVVNQQITTAASLPVGVPDGGEDWSVFIGYLIDKYEGHEIAEENVQGWLSEMLADPHSGALFRREKQPHGMPSAIELAIESAEEEHGGLRAAAKAIGIDAGYLSRLKNGEKLNPGEEVLAALGLERVVTYRTAHAAPTVKDSLSVAARDVLAERQRQITAGGEPFQSRVLPWLIECFGQEIAGDTTERNHRFLEEALELVQACGCTQEEAHKLVAYVYGRDVGERSQEVGGVMVTLAALCLAQRLDMHQCGETELARILQPAMVEKIREKQKRKPAMSPLPGVYPERAQQEQQP